MPNTFFQEKTRRLLSQILQASKDGREALEATRSLEAATQNYDPDQLVERLKSLPERLPASDMADPKSTKDAAETVSRFVKSGLEKARRGDVGSLSEGELASFEAVVRADGSPLATCRVLSIFKRAVGGTSSRARSTAARRQRWRTSPRWPTCSPVA